MTPGWLRKFDEPFPLSKGRQLVTLKDAGKKEALTICLP
jgi:hypothetical protein